MKNTYKYSLVGLITIALIGAIFLYTSKECKPHHNKKCSSHQNKEISTVSCPVMGTKIPKEKAYDKTDYNGKTYYFCCGGCKPEFLKNPEKYIK
jgi:YHS domain-containing protein